MKSDVLKNLAVRAKNRLLNKNLRNTYSNANFKIIDSKEDDVFYAKVKDVINRNEDIFNPIKYLMDDEIMLSFLKRHFSFYIYLLIDLIFCF